jgi:hypothetical protein
LNSCLSEGTCCKTQSQHHSHPEYSACRTLPASWPDLLHSTCLWRSPPQL